MSAADEPTIVNYKPTMDWWLAGVAVLLAGLGVVMVLSSSGVMAERMMHSKYFFFKKQCLFFGLGVALMLAVSFIPRKILYGPVYLWLMLILGLLVLTLIPPFSVKAAGRGAGCTWGPSCSSPWSWPRWPWCSTWPISTPASRPW